MSNKNLENLIQKTAEDTVNKVRLAGMRAGATGILIDGELEFQDIGYSDKVFCIGVYEE